MWKPTLFSEQCLAGTLGGVSGVSEPPSVLDTCDGIEYSTPVHVQLKQNSRLMSKPYVIIATRRWSQSFSDMSANRYFTLTN